MMKQYLFFLIAFFISTTIYSQYTQNGTLRGTVKGDNGEPLMFATVKVVELSTGETTDLDGAFSLSLPAGTYTIEFSYTGYKTIPVSGVEIKAGEVNALGEMVLVEEGVTTETVVVTAKTLKTSVAAIEGLKLKSDKVVDGISKQTFKLSGISDASDALKTVTGTNIQDGKYVIVRGLGDRYSKTVLNTMDIPGLDPDRNTIQMDIFPTSLIDNILVMKSFSPDLPGDFTGGVINIETKEFPESKTLSASVSIGYNPAMHFNSDYIAYEGSSTDFLGYDNGLRTLPFDQNTTIPSPVSGDAQLTTLTRSFSSNLSPQQQTSPINYSFSISSGNQYQKEGSDWTYGYNAALSYRNNTVYYKDAQFNTYIRNEQPSVYELEADRIQRGKFGTNNALLSGLLGFSAKTAKNKYSLNFIHLQNGESKTGDFNQEVYIRNSNFTIRDNLEYSQRSISNALLKGEHSINDNKMTVEWRLSPTYSTLRDKDIRLTAFRIDDDRILYSPSEGAEPVRIYRDLEELNLSGKVDISLKLPNGDFEDSKLKFGFSNTYKTRDYGILNYRFRILGQSQFNNGNGLSGNSDEILEEQNLWTPDTNVGTYVEGNFEPANTYEAVQNVMGIYAMHDIYLADKLRASYGLRVENFQHIYTGENNDGSVVYVDEKLIDSWSFLPAVNFIYSLQEKMNLRFSYTRTVARPSFKEKSIAQIYDVLSDRRYIGNVDLVETDINNLDLRWEVIKKDYMYSMSVFYKTFENPIELTIFKAFAPNEFQPKNVGDANLLGLEVEFRQNLKFLSESLYRLNVGANVTLVSSRVEMDKSPGGEYDSRVNVARDGEVVDDVRQMQGQAPYIINAYINYVGGLIGGPDDKPNPWEANISYNVQGPSLFLIGIGLDPDVFQEPFHSLNMKVSRGFGENNKMRVGLRISNILDATRLKVFQSYQATDQIFERLVPRRAFQLSLNYRFF